LAEVVGLRVEDVDLDEQVLHIRPNDKRRLKTTGSERSPPPHTHGLFGPHNGNGICKR
jgi:integrase